jgi:hypothetical protein
MTEAHWHFNQIKFIFLSATEFISGTQTRELEQNKYLSQMKKLLSCFACLAKQCLAVKLVASTVLHIYVIEPSQLFEVGC